MVLPLHDDMPNLYKIPFKLDILTGEGRCCLQLIYSTDYLLIWKHLNKCIKFHFLSIGYSAQLYEQLTQF